MTLTPGWRSLRPRRLAIGDDAPLHRREGGLERDVVRRLVPRWHQTEGSLSKERAVAVGCGPAGAVEAPQLRILHALYPRSVVDEMGVCRSKDGGEKYGRPGES